MRELVPGFPGWAPVLSSYRRLPRRPSFKSWLKREYAVDLEHLDKVQALIDRMVERGTRPSLDLEGQVEHMVRAADTGTWPSAPPDAQ